MYNFPLLGTYWSAADIAIQHIAKELGGFDKLKGKKISLVFHDSPYGKEPPHRRKLVSLPVSIGTVEPVVVKRRRVRATSLVTAGVGRGSRSVDAG
jgi:hypothetical protein